jgi:hypothetical protein
MKWEQDLTKDIRTFTPYDDRDGGSDAHPYGYGHTCDSEGNIIYPEEVTICNRYYLLENFIKVRDTAKAILEIGVGRNGEDSFVHVLTKNKRKDTVYIGLDLDDRSFLRNPENNIHTIQNDSSFYDENLNIFKMVLGTDEVKFDFIFIDGWHSINQVLRDWEYTNLLADGGVVGFHDVSCHPGPKAFVNALDKTKWEITQNCCPKDWGVAFARKRL